MERKFMGMIYCSECGKQIDENQSSCPNCGVLLNNHIFVQSPKAVQSTDIVENGSIAICAMIFSFLFPPIGIVLGILGLNKQRNKTNLNLCKAAIIISFILTIVYVIILVNLIPFLADTADSLEKGNRLKNILSFLF